MANYYIVLGIERDATTEQIRHAYRTQVRQVHPDLHPHLTDAPERLRELIAARDTLLRPARRAEYDRFICYLEEFARAIMSIESISERPAAGPPASAIQLPLPALALPRFEARSPTRRQFARWQRRASRVEAQFHRWAADERLRHLRHLDQRFLFAALFPREFWRNECLVSYWLGVDAGEVAARCQRSSLWRALLSDLRAERPPPGVLARLLQALQQPW